MISRRNLLGTATMAAAVAVASPAFSFSSFSVAKQISAPARNERLVALYEAAFSMKHLYGTADEHLLADRLDALYDFVLTEYPAPKNFRESWYDDDDDFDRVMEARMKEGTIPFPDDIARWPDEAIPFAVVLHVAHHEQRDQCIRLKNHHTVSDKMYVILDRCTPGKNR
jgi:hypothetical protein